MENRKILLIGWDAADWKVAQPLMDAGKMPTLKRLTEEGTRGNLATIYPILSPMLWTSISTGKRAWKHGIHGFSEPCPNTGTIRPISNLSRKTKAIWNIFNQQGWKSNVIGWWPSHPVEPINGVMISNHYQQAVKPLEEEWPMRPGTVHPKHLEEALKEFRVHPAELQNEHILPFIPKAAEIDQDKDKGMSDCAKTIAEITGIHAAATAVMQREPWDFMAVYYDGIDHFGHRFMRYHPPRLEWVPEDQFEFYKDVIESGYRYHDMMLNVLLQIAGDDTTVLLISDHGFEPGNLRPRNIPNEPTGPAAEHSPLGIFCVRGPGIKKNHEIQSACLLDIAPTLLQLTDLPIGEDMDGRVLSDIFEEKPEVRYIPSWDEVTGEHDDGRHKDIDKAVDVTESREEIKQLVELGYIDEPDEDMGKAVDDTICELQYNLAQAYMDGGYFTEAAKILRKQWDRNPREGRFGTKLFHCYLALKDAPLAREVYELLVERKKDAAKKAIEDLKELHKRLEKEEKEARKEAEEKGEEFEKPELNRRDQQTLRKLRGQANPNERAFAFLEGSLLQLENDPEGALQLFEKCAEVQESLKLSLYRKIGDTHLSMNNPDAAEKAYKDTLAIEPLDSAAHLGMARVYTIRKQPFEAAASASKSLEVNFNNPKAQFLYGCALRNLGKPVMAENALLEAVNQNPFYASAYWELSRLCGENGLNKPEEAIQYKQLGDEAEKRLMEITRNAKNRPDEEASTDWAEFPEIVARKNADGNRERDDHPVIVVSGLPRSGTSLMMQMLDAAGIPIVSDSARKANESNPKGYFEDERVKRLRADADNDWLNKCGGEAIKIVMPILFRVPKGLPQKIIFMQRSASEVVLSQRAMLKRDGKIGSTSENDRLSQLYAKHLEDFNEWVPTQESIMVLPVHYHELLTDPEKIAREVAAFVKPDADIAAMVKRVDPELHRIKSE